MQRAFKPEQVRNLFLASLDQPVEERKDFIQKACGDNRLLEAEVKSLLNSYRENEHLFESPVLRVSAASLATSALNQNDRKFEADIGRYRVLREIGRGGMGVVYEAARIDGEYQQRVAIKFIGSPHNSDFIARRLRKERQILANLNHPNIARLIDGGTSDDGLPYLVMEYVNGLPITKYADAKCLSITDRLRLFREVCSAVHYAHRNLVIHRDIKPTNILVDEQGIPKLLDFGIAKLLDPVEKDDHVDATTALQVMTPEYASPEQVRGEPVTTATDTYSLGVILYELLTGYHPHGNAGVRAEIGQLISAKQPEKPSVIISRAEANRSETGAEGASESESVTRNRATSLDLLRRNLRGDLDTIVLTALRKEPSRRYSSVEKFSEDVGRHLDGLPISARRDSVAYRTTKFVKRNKRSAVAVIAIAVLCLVVGSFLARFTVRGKTRTSVAVLPFINREGDAANLDYVCEGITDNLLTSLSRINGLRVPGRNSVVRYSNASVDPQVASTELNVETILNGTVKTDGGNLLINVTLVDNQRRPLYAKQYRANSSEIQSVEAEIAEDVLHELGWELNRDQQNQIRSPGTSSAEAYDLYVKGSHFFNQRTAQSLEKAEEFYRDAIRLDPNYALAYVGWANAKSLRAAYLVEKPESFEEARRHVETALRIDPNLPEAHNSMGLINWLYDWNWPLAESEFKRAIELNPNVTLAHHWYGLFLAEMGRADESIAEEQRALQLDPLSIPVTSDLGRVYYFARRYDEALKAYQTAWERLAGIEMGDFRPLLDQLFEARGMKAELLSHLYPDSEAQRALTDRGWNAFWQIQLNRTAMLPYDWRIAYSRAELYAKLNENTLALNNLQLALESHHHQMTQLKVNPAFDNLRSDPRFIALLHRMNLA